MAGITEAVERSVDLLKRALLPAGFVASPADDHYAALWARDAALACLGASRSGDPVLEAGVEQTLRSLASVAGEHGQIPNAYWPSRRYWDWGEAGATDATAWFVIALGEHVAVTSRADIAEELWPSVVAALRWLDFQDVTGTGLVSSQAGGDWMDSSLNRSGRVFHVNVLFHWAVLCGSRLAPMLGFEAAADPAAVAQAVERLFWPQRGIDLATLVQTTHSEDPLFPHPLSAGEYERLASGERSHYLAGVSYGRFTDRCDVLAHCLGIASGLIGGERAEIVLDYLDEQRCDHPYPSRTWPRPFAADEPGSLLDPAADALQAPRWRNSPGHYHNGAVWPYIGAVHSLAAALAGRTDRAVELLRGVADANALDEWGFTEWISVPDGKPLGARDQTWNAGAFLWAYSVVTQPNEVALG